MELASRTRHPAEPGNRDEGLQVMQVHLAIKKLMVALLIPAPTDVAGA